MNAKERAATPARGMVDRISAALPAFLALRPAPVEPGWSFEPGELVEGAQVEYYSESNRCWIPSVVTSVDADTGALALNVRPTRPIAKKDQKKLMRPRSRPNRQQLEWVRTVLREGRLYEEARVIFNRLAVEAQGGGAVLQDLDAAGQELDAKLGISGCVCTLRDYAEQQREMPEDGALAIDGFYEAFWDLLWTVQRDFCQALPSDAAAAPACSENPREVYEFVKDLGQGSYGTVKLAQNRTTGATCAIKLISKRGPTRGALTSQLEVEIERLRLLDHPHIVKLYEHYQDSQWIYLVMDFCSGGELEGLIKKNKARNQRLSESFVSDVMRQVMLAIAHVHARGIVHLDLKATNIMLTKSRSTLPPGRQAEGATIANIEESPHVMVIDLGVAQIFRPGDFADNKPSGTPMTMAPEVWNGIVHPKADVFSCGVVLFEMLALAYPFRVPRERCEAVSYWNRKPAIPWSLVSEASEASVGLCRSMLMRQRSCRPTAAQCLQAPFLLSARDESGGGEPVPVPDKIVDQLVSAPKRSLLYKSVALSIARVWPSNQLPTIKRLFYELDSAQTGRIALSQLEELLKDTGNLTPCDAAEAADAMDLSRNGLVSWTHFVAACIDLGSNVFDQDLRQLFDDADADHDGLLGQRDIAGFLAGEHLREEAAVGDVFAELAGTDDPSARVDWPTFRRHFRGESRGAEVASLAPAAAAEEPAAEESPLAAVLGAGLLEQARVIAEWARGAAWPELAPPADERRVSEEDLRQLREMGFTDRELCVAALRRHGNSVNDFVIEELVADTFEL
eukprot:CAMPEP_0175233010 /NCGR_PEP_ID=MMETSP0093-20121207/26252_1 /TAXON_ID=311494 /ORGANISM="Alexandrium monilatum, Strain CCMP3105" /LENGTH=793 /DNA_ID=CAMNT_0016526881 /DNA_START=32 /DNA_END=2413 /DNA_ORIENTATION=-